MLFFVLESQRADQLFFFFFQAEDGIRDADVTGVQTCALPITGQGPGADARPGRRRRSGEGMSEHGWPDHHDDPGYHDDHHDPLHEPADGAHDGEAPPLPDDDGYWDLHHDDAGPAPDEPHDLVYEHH